MDCSLLGDGKRPFLRAYLSNNQELPRPGERSFTSEHLEYTFYKIECFGDIQHYFLGYGTR